jgi:hypothetical protein
MQKGGNARFIAYAKETGIHDLDVVQKYNSEHAAIYSARLKSEATGEPYVAPVARTASRPAATAGGTLSSMGSGGQLSHGPIGASMARNGSGGGMNGLGRNSSGSGVGGGGMSGGSMSGGGISSDMWAASNGNPAAMPSVSSMSYQQGGGGRGRGYGGGGGGGPGLNDVARHASRNLTAIASQVQNSQAFGTASQAAAQAGGMLSSWFTSAASQASSLLQEGAGGGAASSSLLREDLRRNLANAPPASAGGAGFVGFSSDDYMRQHSAPASSLSTGNGYQQHQQHQPVQPPSQFCSAPTQPQKTPVPAVAPSDANAGWGGFDDVPGTDTDPAKDSWGSWD